MVYFGIAKNQLLRYSLTTIQAQVFVTASIIQLLEWDLIASMVKFQSERHANLLDVHREDFNKLEKRIFRKVRVAIFVITFYHFTKIVLLTVFEYHCHRSDHCEFTRNQVFSVFLICDIIEIILCFCYFFDVIVRLWQQTYKRFRFEFLTHRRFFLI